MYGFSISTSFDFDEAIDKTTEALKAEGFGVLSDIDVAKTLKAKLDVDMRPYRILGACNPPFAHQAVSSDPDIGLLLPCNVVVRAEDDGSVSVAFMEPKAVLHLVNRADIDAIGQEISERLHRVKDALAG